MEIIERYLNSNVPMFRNTKIHYIPPGINPDIFFDRDAERDIEVSMVCTANPVFKFHQQRVLVKDFLRKFPFRTFVSPAWGDQYVDILQRSKIVIVDGAMRGHLVEKYLEAAACGAMLMGEIPTTAKGLFIDGLTICNIPNYGAPGFQAVLDKKLRYFINHVDERLRMAAECEYRILEAYPQKLMVAKFERIILDDWINKKLRW